jgi:alpha-keto-acid decarboxylase
MTNQELEKVMGSPRFYTIMDYLLDRLTELGIDRIFGVPGDFTLGMLDHVVAAPRMSWTGCTNELNAGYAADGYARLRGAGALMTTFGVGELSAVNAVAGSYAEHVPVVHIVGAPATATQDAGRKIHHTLGDGDFTHFAHMYAQITGATATLTAGNAVAEIDRVLATVRARRRPGYLLLPLDVAELPVDRPSAPLPVTEADVDPVVLAAFTTEVGRLLDAADSHDVAVLAGVLTHRLGAQPELGRLLSAGPITSATTLWGKSVVDECRPGHLGVYAGAASEPVIRSAIENAGTLIVAGVEITDLNSGFFSQRFTEDRTIELGVDEAWVAGRSFSGIGLRAGLAVLADLVSCRRIVPPSTVGRLTGPISTGPTSTAPTSTAPTSTDIDAPLDQQRLWSAVAEQLRTGDIVLADQGTAFYGMAAQTMPADVTFVGQPLWASIGYTLPAALGAGLAEPGRRVVLLIGDGAAQMTVQELSTIARHTMPMTVIVIDNDGYTIERAIHGPNEVYNDIASWDWTSLAHALGVPPGRAVLAESVGELRSALNSTRGGSDTLTLIQARVPRMDLPRLLADLAVAASAANVVAAR